MGPPRIRFAPVALKARHDGWTAVRQVRFIKVLAATKSVSKACAAVGMSRMSAYKLRDRPEARQFRLAWNHALRPGFDQPGARRRNPRIAARVARTKVDDVQEVHVDPDSSEHSQSTLSALTTLQSYLDLLRSREDALGSARGE